MARKISDVRLSRFGDEGADVTKFITIGEIETIEEEESDTKPKRTVKSVEKLERNKEKL